MPKSRLCAGVQCINNQIHIALVEKHNNDIQVKECVTVHDADEDLAAVKKQLSALKSTLKQPLSIVFAVPSADVMTTEFVVPHKFKQTVRRRIFRPNTHGA